MKYAYLTAVLALTIVTLASTCGATLSFTINLDNPPNGPDITGQGWQNPCTASGNSCPLYCGRFEDSNWMPGYYFDSPFAGDGTCTLTLKAASFSVLAGTGPNQVNEVVEAQVNGVVFDRTPDICTGLGASCACNIATKVSTRTVPLTLTGNHITVRMPGDSIAVKGAILTCTGEITCDEEWADEYQCQGHSLMRKWINEDCSEEWREYEYCDYGCDDEECIPGCDPGYTNNTRCNGNWLQREYENYDCSTTWQNYEYCNYGCSGGSCEPHEDPYCTDSDGGIVYNTQGNTYGVNNWFVSYSKSDYCSGNTLYEYYCNSTNWNVTTITCTGNCYNGACVNPGCTDECSTLNIRECYSNGYRICGYYDADNCLDWSYTPCGCDQECVNGYCGGDCDDECGDVGWESDYRCSGNWLQRLYTYDDGGDCADEWRNYEYCTEGCSNDECNDDDCGNGICSNGETCSTCPSDCGSCNTCGNGICSNGETCSNCPSDCGQCSYCGNGICGLGESCSNCPSDCGQCGYCGNGICSGGETCSTCPTDCGSCNTCGNGICGVGESCYNCPTDCGQCSYCGNGVCGLGESCTNCPNDCGTCSGCGDGTCAGSGESCSTCPSDCGICSSCGNGICSGGETCLTCQSDCGTCASCGDGFCGAGETCASCQVDCGICDSCGDGSCTGGETCSNCQSDCGLCITACAIPIGDNVEVSAVACVEFRGTGTDVFNLTVYSKEDHTATFGIRLEGEASSWSVAVPNSLDIPARRNATAQIRVTIPNNIDQGLYNLTAIISSGGEDIAEKQLFVSVAEPVEPGQQPVAVITTNPQTPSGAVVIGEAELIWALIALGAIVNIALLFVLVKKRKGRSA